MNRTNLISSLILSRIVSAARRAQMLHGAALSSCADALERAMGHVDAGAIAKAYVALRGVERDVDAAERAARVS